MADAPPQAQQGDPPPPETGDDSGKGSKDAVLADLAKERRERQKLTRELEQVRQQSMTDSEKAAAEAEKRGDGQPDIAALIQAAVDKALAPLQEATAQREAEQAAGRIRDAVTAAAGERFHDATDALTQVDLPSLTDGNGQPDPQKITVALDGLLTRKPHLGKPVDDRRRAAPGAPVGATPGAVAPLDDRVKATLTRMQQATGVKFAGD